MTDVGRIAFNSQENFGRDGAMFESLLGFVAELSIVLWSLVILTVVLRFVGIRLYRRGARAAATSTTTSTAARPAVMSGAGQRTPAAANDEDLADELLSSGRVPALAAHSAGA